MFTGIIQEIGYIQRVETLANGLCLSIASPYNDLSLGESIAIDGACLTVSAKENSNFQVELSTETLAKTIACFYKVGQAVNLERALAIGDRLGGHFVSGHVDQVATVLDITQHQDFYHCTIGNFGANIQPFLIDKGSITINGVSLTINTINNAHIEVMLIPHTLKKTQLQQLQVNDSVNIEFDLLAKIVHKKISGAYDEKTVQYH